MGRTSPTLILATLLTGGIAASFAYAGSVTWRRSVQPESRLANVAFALWWWSASAVLGLFAIGNLLGLAGFYAADAHLTLHFLRALPLSLALGCLMFYLLYLLTGRRDLVVPVALAYAGHFAFTTYYFVAMGPWTVVETTWDVRVQPSEPLHGPLSIAFGVALAGPLLVAWSAYLVQAYPLAGPEQRYRLAVLSLSLGQWFVLLLVSFLLGLEDEPWFSFLYQLPGFLSALFVVMALRPPAWLRTHLPLSA